MRMMAWTMVLALPLLAACAGLSKPGKAQQAAESRVKAAEQRLEEARLAGAGERDLAAAQSDLQQARARLKDRKWDAAQRFAELSIGLSENAKTAAVEAKKQPAKQPAKKPSVKKR